MIVEESGTRRLFNVDEYHLMAKAGILHEDDPIELINGEIIEMSPIGTPYINCVNRLTMLLVPMLVDKAIVSVQNPIRLNKFNEPEPDIAVLKLREDEYAYGPPTPEDALLLIEIADTTVRYDTKVKIPLYANYGVPEVWLVDLNKQKVVVYTDRSEGTYETKQTFKGDTMMTASQMNEIQLSPEKIIGKPKKN